MLLLLQKIDPVARAQDIFGNLDVDGDGEITEDEFILGNIIIFIALLLQGVLYFEGCMEDRDLVDTLNGDKDSEVGDDY